MKRLSGMDAAFLYIETPAMHMHVVGTVVLDPSTMPGGYSFDRFREMVRERLHLLPPFRRRLVPVPLGMGHPYWVEDPDFDLDAHIIRVAVPSPGGMRELGGLVGNIASRPLDRDRPLWEMWVVEGLEKGRVAVVAKVHHSSIDGVSGADLMVHLFDLTPDAHPEPATTEWHPEPVPAQWRLVPAALVSQLTRPVGLAATSLQTATGLVRHQLERRSQRDGAPGGRRQGPPTPFNGAITPHRSVAYGRVSLEDVKATKDATGTKVNDVVLAACTMSLREWLRAHDALPDRPLVAACPMAVPQDPSSERVTNAMTIITALLPVHVEDPLDQLRLVHEDTTRAKRSSKAFGVDVLQAWAQYTSPNLVSAAMRVYSNLGLADRHDPIANLIVSNVPGPPLPLYCAGARVDAVYPMGPLIEGIGLNLTVLSNMGNVDFGVIACRELVPDVWDVATGFEAAVARLREAAGVAKPNRKPPVKKTAKRATTRRAARRSPSA
ncbi:MAG TPA: wax ester/triacylglycerol synthase family O-acyltransferase [Acidimicrobiia bacterium]|nr:wax ester/triacylglycerol synthase family O-acyltransferase [Acidimicrobiia bacterium]